MCFLVTKRCSCLQELLDHLEGMLSNEAVVVTVGQAIVEVKPQVHTSVVLLSLGTQHAQVLVHMYVTRVAPLGMLVLEGDLESCIKMLGSILVLHKLAVLSTACGLCKHG